jgi:hypothetical protein
MLAQTPVGGSVPPRQLGDALEAHQAVYSRDVCFSLGYPERKWLDLIEGRAQQTLDARLVAFTKQMLELLRDPRAAGADFRKQFIEVYDAAGWRAYPLSWRITTEIHGFSGITADYTLQCFDRGMLQLMDDDALVDTTMKTFVDEMLQKLQAKSSRPRHAIYPEVLEIYSEALVYRLLKERGEGRLTIKKIPSHGPDFECVLPYDKAGIGECDLTFYIEVKTLDIVDPVQRLPQMLDEGIDTELELDRQRLAGKKVAIATQAIAPYRKSAVGTAYDARSPRLVIETLIKKLQEISRPPSSSAARHLPWRVCCACRYRGKGRTRSRLISIIREEVEHASVEYCGIWRLVRLVRRYIACRISRAQERVTENWSVQDYWWILQSSCQQRG